MLGERPSVRADSFKTICKVPSGEVSMGQALLCTERCTMSAAEIAVVLGSCLKSVRHQSNAKGVRRQELLVQQAQYWTLLCPRIVLKKAFEHGSRWRSEKEVYRKKKVQRGPFGVACPMAAAEALPSRRRQKPHVRTRKLLWTEVG